jgi:hypothetical protein
MQRRRTWCREWPWRAANGLRISSLELVVATLEYVMEGAWLEDWGTHDVGADLPPGDGVHCDHDGCCLEIGGGISGGMCGNGSMY